MSGIAQVAADARSTRARSVRRAAAFFAIAFLVVALDQLTKWAIRTHFSLGDGWSPAGLSFIRIVHFTNSGAAFGILQGQTPLLLVTSVVGIAAILLYFLYPPMDHPLVRVALAMQLGGALGNLTDRVLRGEVTDWIDVGSWPTFNLADSSITVSVLGVLVFLTLFSDRPAEQR